MSPADVVAQLEAVGVRLQRDGGRLLVRPLRTGTTLAPELAEGLRSCKVALLELLAEGQVVELALRPLGIPCGCGAVQVAWTGRGPRGLTSICEKCLAMAGEVPGLCCALCPCPEREPARPECGCSCHAAWRAEQGEAEAFFEDFDKALAEWEDRELGCDVDGEEDRWRAFFAFFREQRQTGGGTR